MKYNTYISAGSRTCVLGWSPEDGWAHPVGTLIIHAQFSPVFAHGLYYVFQFAESEALVPCIRFASVIEYSLCAEQIAPTRKEAGSMGN